MTPREKFQVSPYAKDFAALAVKESFEPACDYALLQLQSEMPGNTHPSLPTDPYVGLDANAQMQGAMRVLDILKTIYQKQEPPKPIARQTLKY